MKIQDYLHLYIGCKVEFDNRVGIIHTYYLPAGKYMEDKVWFCSLEEDGNPEMSCAVPATSVKPILRPLSDMTEEEGWDIIEHLPAPFNQLIGTQDLRDMLDPNCEGYARVAPSLLYAVIPFVLAKGFDLFGLIEAGLAIDKTKEA